ncbi:hypothetical protein LXL04_024195 [Taraxacum kok-saghyz]
MDWLVIQILHLVLFGLLIVMDCLEVAQKIRIDGDLKKRYNTKVAFVFCSEVLLTTSVCAAQMARRCMGLTAPADSEIPAPTKLIAGLQLLVAGLQRVVAVFSAADRRRSPPPYRPSISSHVCRFLQPISVAISGFNQSRFVPISPCIQPISSQQTQVHLAYEHVFEFLRAEFLNRKL